jgi:hypothetical protein
MGLIPLLCIFLAVAGIVACSIIMRESRKRRDVRGFDVVQTKPSQAMSDEDVRKG